MIAEERYKKILGLLQIEGIVKIANLCTILSTTTETVRRDLMHLEKNKLLKKVHGGAVRIAEHNVTEASFHDRYSQNFSAKRIIAKLAMRNVEEKATIMLDASSTAYYLVEYIKNFKNLTVISNSLKVLDALSYSEVKVIGVGGELDSSVGAFIGLQTLNALDNFYPTHCFISCHGLDTDLGIMDISLDEAMVKEKILAQATKKYLLIDHTKLGKRGVVKIKQLDSIDYFIIDKKPPECWLDFFSNHPAELIYPE